MEQGGTKLTISLAREPIEIDGLPVKSAEAFELGFGPITPDQMRKALVDAQLFTELLTKYPDEMRELVNDVMAGRRESAMQRAARVGLSEKQFQDKGGGVLFIIGIVAFGVFIIGYAAVARPQ